MEEIKIKKCQGINDINYYWEDASGYRISVQKGPESIISTEEILEILKERVNEYTTNKSRR